MTPPSLDALREALEAMNFALMAWKTREDIPASLRERMEIYYKANHAALAREPVGDESLEQPSPNRIVESTADDGTAYREANGLPHVDWKFGRQPSEAPASQPRVLVDKICLAQYATGVIEDADFPSELFGKKVRVQVTEEG